MIRRNAYTTNVIYWITRAMRCLIWYSGGRSERTTVGNQRGSVGGLTIYPKAKCLIYRTDLEQGAGGMIELQRCRDATSLEDVTRILGEAGIQHRIESTAPAVDLSRIGSGNDAQLVVSVRDEDYDAAREAMEADSLKFGLPEDHYLLTSTDEELAEMVAAPDEWSAFDVAHARRLMKERGVTPAMVESKREVHLEQLRAGKRASKYLIAGGWIFCFLGGIIGLGIAWSLCYMKDKTPKGEFHTYDEWSRRIGLSMYKFGWVMTTLHLAVRLISFAR